MSDTSDLNLFTFHHRNTSLEVRDRLAFSARDVARFVEGIQTLYGCESAVLSTCNRTEFYVWGPPTLEWSQLEPLVREIRQMPSESLSRPSHLYGIDAARHLFRVATSMESLALGEDQILAQIKEVHRQVLESPGKFPILDRLYQFAIRAGKRVRTETALCEGAVSISSASVELAKKIFGGFDALRIVLVGAGETAASAAEHFQASGGRDFVVVNRGRDRGEKLASELQADFLELSSLRDALSKADIAIFATGSQTHLLQESALKGLMKTRGYRPLFLIDISNPRNVDPKCSEASGVFLYNIDDLKTVVAANLKTREREIPLAEAIVEELVGEWEAWLQTLRIRPTISLLARYFEEVRATELKKVENKLSDEELARLDAFSRSLIKKLLHNPIMFLRESAEHNSLASQELQIVWDLYRLNAEQEDT